MVLRTELVGRKGKAKKAKCVLTPSGRASAGRIAGRHPLGKHYTPCQCQPMCGKECPCLKNTTCCEKYCGCVNINQLIICLGIHINQRTEVRLKTQLSTCHVSHSV